MGNDNNGLTVYQASQNCFNQLTNCYNTAPATGNEACRLFEAKCNKIQAECPSGNPGPPDKGKDLSAAQTTIAIPAPLGPTNVGISSNNTGDAPVTDTLATNTADATVVASSMAGSYETDNQYNGAVTSTTTIMSFTTVIVTVVGAEQTASADSPRPSSKKKHKHHHHPSKRHHM
jgi:hypothetical protein